MWIVEHLTRMRGDRVCVGLLDSSSGARMRPHLSSRQPWTRDHLGSNGGPLDVGAVVELEKPQRTGTPPQIEDHYIRAIQRVGRLRDHVFWEALMEHASAHISVALGAGVMPHGRGSAACPPGQGERSLASISPVSCELVQRGDRLRVELDQPLFGLMDVAVTDVRLYDIDGLPCRDAVRSAAVRLASGLRPILSIGLARPFGTPPLHWLQVNNIHFPDYYDDHPTVRGDPQR